MTSRCCDACKYRHCTALTKSRVCIANPRFCKGCAIGYKSTGCTAKLCNLRRHKVTPWVCSPNCVRRANSRCCLLSFANKSYAFVQQATSWICVQKRSFCLHSFAVHPVDLQQTRSFCSGLFTQAAYLLRFCEIEGQPNTTSVY